MDYNQLVKNLFVRLEDAGIKLNNVLRSDVYTFVNLFRSCDVQLFQEFENTKGSFGFNSEELTKLCRKAYSHVDDDKVVALHLFNNYFNNGYSFHLTNGHNAKLISESGIGPEYKDAYNAELLELMNNFGPDLRRNLFIFALRDTKTTSFSGAPLFSSRYGYAPEWFLEYSMCGENLVNTDKEKGIENGINYVKSFDPTPQELETYAKYLKKYWDIYAKDERSLVLIPNRYIYDTPKVIEMASHLSLEQVVKLLLQVIQEVDKKIEKSVPASELIIEDGFGNKRLFTASKDYEITAAGLGDEQYEDVPSMPSTGIKK